MNMNTSLLWTVVFGSLKFKTLNQPFVYNVETLYIPPHCKQFQTVHLSNKNQCFATALVTSKLRLPLHVHVKLIVAYICLYSFVLAIKGEC